MNQKPQFVYIAFDVFPSKKGAATHINHCLKALQNTFNTGLLICLGHDDMPAFQFDTARNLYIYRWKGKILNFLERTQEFQKAVSKLLVSDLCDAIQLIHFRDVWGGFPAIKLAKNVQLVYEVNAFNHIELLQRYPNMSPSALEKIKDLEKQCIQSSDTIITPSQVTKDFIIGFGDIDSVKVTVISNGVTIYKSDSISKTNTPKTPCILYFGALQKWQGIKTLFKALKELQDLDIRLTICASVPEKRTHFYQELAQDIGVGHQIDWLFELDKPQLATLIKNALLTVAPLASCDRNIVQGCNPLKIIESLAYGTPVVASDLPVVKELIEDTKTGFLVPPDRPELLGRKIRSLLMQPKTLEHVGKNGKKAIENNYLWEYQEAKMMTVYKTLLEYA